MENNLQDTQNLTAEQKLERLDSTILFVQRAAKVYLDVVAKAGEPKYLHTRKAEYADALAFLDSLKVELQQAAEGELAVFIVQSAPAATQTDWSTGAEELHSRDMLGTQNSQATK